MKTRSLALTVSGLGLQGTSEHAASFDKDPQVVIIYLKITTTAKSSPAVLTSAQGLWGTVKSRAVMDVISASYTCVL